MFLFKLTQVPFWKLIWSISLRCFKALLNRSLFTRFVVLLFRPFHTTRPPKIRDCLPNSVFIRLILIKRIDSTLTALLETNDNWCVNIDRGLLNGVTTLQCEDHVKYLGVLLDSNLSWKFQINNVALKISRTVGVVARLRHFVPRTTLLNIYQSLILPYLTYGLAAWGQAAKTHLQKILVLQKRVLRLMYFSEPRAHAVPLFISSKILPLQMLYAEKVSSIMFDLSCMNAPSNICDFFTKANSKHKHETRFSSSGNYYVQTSRLNLNQDSFSRFGAKLWNAIPNEFRQLSKGAFKKNFHDFLLSIMEAEDDYVEVSILLQKKTSSAALTKCTNNW